MAFISISITKNHPLILGKGGFGRQLADWLSAEGWGEAEFLDDSAFCLKCFCSGKDCILDFRIKAFTDVILRDTDLHAFDIVHKCLSEFEIIAGNRCRILRIMRSDRLKDGCTIGHILGNRSNLIERRTVCDQSVTGYGSIRWLNSGYTTEGTWLTDGSAGVGAQSVGTFFRSHCCTRSTGRSSRYMLLIPRILRLAVCGCLSRTSHRELIHIRFSDNDRACIL